MTLAHLLFSGQPYTPPPPPPDPIEPGIPGAPGAFLPPHIVEFSTSNPGATPVWVNISAYVRGITINRGRQQELGRVEAGTCTIRLNNRDRRFDPTNTSGPLFPNWKPGRRVRIQFTYPDTLFPVFDGYIERLPPKREGPLESEVEVSCIDGFAVLAQAEIDAAFPVEVTGARIHRALDAIGWPATSRLIDPGLSVITDSDLDQVSALEHIQEVADSENGIAFMDTRGRLVFHDRYHRMLPAYATSQAVFGDINIPASISGELPYIDLVPSYDLDEVYNDVRVSLPNEPDPALAYDLASQAAYFKRSLSRSTLLEDWYEAVDHASALLSRYKEPELRFDSMRLKPRMDPLLWPHVLGRDIGQKITVRHRPPGGGPLLEQKVFIEGIQHEIDGLDWFTTWQLSPSSNQTLWILEDPVYGAIDAENQIAY